MAEEAAAGNDPVSGTVGYQCKMACLGDSDRPSDTSVPHSDEKSREQAGTSGGPTNGECAANEGGEPVDEAVADEGDAGKETLKKSEGDAGKETPKKSEGKAADTLEGSPAEKDKGAKGGKKRKASQRDSATSEANGARKKPDRGSEANGVQSEKDTASSDVGAIGQFGDIYLNDAPWRLPRRNQCSNLQALLDHYKPREEVVEENVKICKWLMDESAGGGYAFCK
eukprot:GHVU01186430.1.p1 GENE.GHVU01186430.1~~GHVU01186430.1.p1  ORF type:complete len:226 (-),score=41.41 GHVU01186430.1:683-1360(-)